MLCYSQVIEQLNSLVDSEVFLKTLVIIQMLLKVNYFLRIYQSFGLLVTLIRKCLKDIGPFTTYFMMFEVFFVMLFKVIGIEPSQRNGLNSFFNMFFFVFENSIGNINDPDDKTFSNKKLSQG